MRSGQRGQACTFALLIGASENPFGRLRKPIWENDYKKEDGIAGLSTMKSAKVHACPPG